MIKNLYEYFEPEHEIYLDNISYEKLEKSVEIKQYTVNCTDNLTVRIDGDIVDVIVQRNVEFVPAEIYKLSVSFGTTLRFKAKNSISDFDNINWAEEFKESDNFIIDNIMSRITLMIAQITSSFGQQPLVMPPKIGG